MFLNQQQSITQYNANNKSKSDICKILSQKEKNISLFSKKLNLEHREFGNDLTNIALTVFEKSKVQANKPILKAIELIKANRKNKERSREKSSTKSRKQTSLRNSKNSKKDEKKRQNYKMAQGKENEKKRSRYESKKSNLSKNELISITTKASSTINIVKNENNVNISEFNIEEKKMTININNSLPNKKEENHHNKLMSKITEISIKIDKETIPKNKIIDEHLINKYDLQYVREYQEEIIEYLLSLEYRKRINPNYMHEQRDINEKMRIILIDWLIEVHLKFKLLPETLFLTINFIDRYLQKKQTPREKLQLIAVSSLLIACKYEEIYPPEISSFVYITDNAYKKEDILNYELKILDTLGYDVTYPTPLRFLELLIIKLGLIGDEIFFLKMQYLLELSLSKLVFYNYTYLELVIACCLFIFEKDFNMTQNILICFDLFHNKEKLEKIKNCITEIKKLLEYINENKGAFKGVRQKFALEKYGCISKIQFY